MEMNREKVERALFLLQEWQERKKTDPLLNFEPHSKQRPFIDAVLAGANDENWFLAANRSGKSDAGAYCGATLARFGDQSPDVRFVGGAGSSVEVRDRATSGWVVALDFPASRDIIQPKYFDNGFMPPGASHLPFIHQREVDEWRVGDQILKLKNGSLIGFKSCESGRLKFQGADKEWVHLDEEPPKEIYEEIIIRVGVRKLRIFATCTLLPPEGQIGGVTWVYTERVKPWQQGRLGNIGIFGSSIYDNPHIMLSEIKRLEAIYPAGSVQRRIRLNGEFLPGLTGSRVYTGFQYKINVRKQPEINLRRPLAWIWDFNVDPMCCLLGARDGRLFRIYKELVFSDCSVPEMCDAFKGAHAVHLSMIWIYGDATGKHRSPQSKQSSYDLILNNMQNYSVPIQMKVPETNPSVPLRINAVNRVCFNEVGEVMLEIDPSCEELINDLEGVISDGKGGIKKTYDRKDVYSKRTHTSDALGYWIAFEEPVRHIQIEQKGDKIDKVPLPSYSFSRAKRMS